jgi:hypothetical protein
MSALREALKAVKSDIVTLPTPKKVAAPKKYNAKPATVTPIRPKQFVNGYEVVWMDMENEARKVPVIRTANFMIQFPTKGSEIKLPEGTVMATYCFAKKRVEFFDNKGEMIRYVLDGRHEPLPIPRYMSELENIEEIFDIDLETGEITSEMKIEVLPEEVHWKLRLQEFEAQQIRSGISPRMITFKLQKYLKNLEALRGITVEMLSKPIPKEILDAISYAEKKQQAIAIGGK